MELPRRSPRDELLRPGMLTELRQRLRQVAPGHDLATVIACAFDHRTRMLPFIFADTRMAPAGVRAIGSALVDAGFEKTRIVLQQWNRNFRPSLMRLDGRVPDLFLVSTMGMHSDHAMKLMADARRIDPKIRPLVIAGGSQAIYQPHLLFSGDPAQPGGPDIAVTGEEYVFLSLLEVLLATRAGGESMRSAFLRAKAMGALDEIPGLVYPLGQRDGVAEKLVDTGMQRLLGDLDELPHPVHGYRLLEPPSRSASLASKALDAKRVLKYSPISSLVLTFGCKFACPYCPIPGYNQRQYRVKSGPRIADEMWQLNKEYGLRHFFGADDNFFNNKARTLNIVETLASIEFEGKPLRRVARWYTEVTVHDTLQMKEHLPLMRKAGCRALWLGVEDLTATLIKKGQSVAKTEEAFQALCAVGIAPMPMMMHYDTQPLYTRGTSQGLLNQIRILRKAGAVSLQVLMITPSPGSRHYEQMYADGLVLDAAGGRKVKSYMIDGNHVVASKHARPWRQQFNLLAAYLYFYNPLNLVRAVFKRHNKVGAKLWGMQIVGMLGLTQNIRRTVGWGLRLMTQKVQRITVPPIGQIPMCGAHGEAAACHAPAAAPEQVVSAGREAASLPR